MQNVRNQQAGNENFRIVFEGDFAISICPKGIPSRRYGIITIRCDMPENNNIIECRFNSLLWTVIYQGLLQIVNMQTGVSITFKIMRMQENSRKKIEQRINQNDA